MTAPHSEDPRSTHDTDFEAATNEHSHHQPVDGCPVCALFSTVQGAHPQATAHLATAGRELIAAFRAFLDAAESALDEQYPASSDGPPPSETAPNRLRRIDLS